LTRPTSTELSGRASHSAGSAASASQSDLFLHLGEGRRQLKAYSHSDLNALGRHSDMLRLESEAGLKSAGSFNSTDLVNQSSRKEQRLIRRLVYALARVAAGHRGPTAHLEQRLDGPHPTARAHELQRLGALAAGQQRPREGGWADEPAA
jgi:hypothetical protein